MTTDRNVYLVDDEEAIRRSEGFLLKTSGYIVRTFTSGDAFLAESNRLPLGCVLLDIRMPGLDGLDVQRVLNERGASFPVIILTGHADIALSVRALKAGAIDFIEKPFRKTELMEAIEEAFRQLDNGDRYRLDAAAANVRLAVLTPRERDVLDGLVDGLPNKTIAFDLEISSRTVEVHRANLMSKLGVRSLSQMLRLAFAAEAVPRPERYRTARDLRTNT